MTTVLLRLVFALIAVGLGCAVLGVVRRWVDGEPIIGLLQVRHPRSWMDRPVYSHQQVSDALERIATGAGAGHRHG